MCNDKLIRLKKGIEQRKSNNLYFSETDTTLKFPSMSASNVYKALANEDHDIVGMIDILIGCDE
jgi:hypothetical protein